MTGINSMNNDKTTPATATKIAKPESPAEHQDGKSPTEIWQEWRAYMDFQTISLEN